MEGNQINNSHKRRESESLKSTLNSKFAFLINQKDICNSFNIFFVLLHLATKAIFPSNS